MRSRTLTLLAATLATIALAGCAHDGSRGRDHAMMAGAGEKDCAMRMHDGDRRDDRDHESQSAQRGDGGHDSKMAGCRMMDHGKDTPGRRETPGPEASDPHAAHRP